MDIDKIEHKYKKHKKNAKTLFNEIKGIMDNSDKGSNTLLLCQLNSELEKTVLMMRVYLSLINKHY